LEVKGGRLKAIRKIELILKPFTSSL